MIQGKRKKGGSSFNRRPREKGINSRGVHNGQLKVDSVSI